MVPPFGLMKREKVVLGLFVLSGLAGLALFPFGILNRFETGRDYLQMAETLLWFPNRLLLILQGLLVMLAGAGAVFRSFTVVAAGIAAGLVCVTPVGVLTVLPAIGVLFLVLPRRKAFREFMPRFKDEGPKPPGNWR